MAHGSFAFRNLRALKNVFHEFTSFKKEEKLEEESYYDKVPIPANVNRFLKRFVGALKDGNLNRNKQIAVLMQVVKALGLSPQELVRYTQKVKRSI